MSSPEFAGIQELVSGILANPYTFNPGTEEALYRQGLSTANEGANQFLESAYAKSGQGGGFRSGATRDAEFEVGARLGEGLARAYRDTQLQVMQQNMQDRQNAIGTGTQFLNQQYALDQGVANARTGQAQILATLGGQASPGQRAGAGIGQLFGNLGSAYLGNK